MADDQNEFKFDQTEQLYNKVASSKKLKYNPNNKKHVDAKKAEDGRREARVQAEYRRLLSCQSGRELLRELRNFCGVTVIPYDTNPNVAYMKMGQMNVGFFVETQLKKADPANYVKMLVEYVNE